MKKVLLLLLCVMLLPLTAFGEVFFDQEAPADWKDENILRLTAFKTGESDCMLLEANGEYMMVDGGCDMWREELKNAMEKRGIKHFKYLYNTHPHDDHIDGLYRLMQFGFTADEFLTPFPKDMDDWRQRRTVNIAEKNGIPYRQMKNGDMLELGEASLKNLCWEKGHTVNEKSGILHVVFKNSSLLLCADASGGPQRFLLENGDLSDLKSDIVKAPHHGLNAFVKEFLDAVDPEMIFVTNFVKRTPDTINQARNRNIPLYHSGAGTITMVTDGNDWYVSQSPKKF